MHELWSLLGELESKMGHYLVLSPEVSQATVGWHIEHALLALVRVVGELAASDPQALQVAQATAALKRLLESGCIPRGKAIAPAASVPPSAPTPQSLSHCLKQAKAALEKIPNLHPNQHFTHAILGTMTTKNALEFLKIHTRHHLFIINDILKHQNI